MTSAVTVQREKKTGCIYIVTEILFSEFLHATVCNDYLFYIKYVEMMNENSQAKK